MNKYLISIRYDHTLIWEGIITSSLPMVAIVKAYDEAVKKHKGLMLEERLDISCSPQ